MVNPTVRVLTLLELLQTHRHMNGRELAERLGVDRRTLRRYIQALEELGIPVTSERGRQGGYRLMPGFKLPPLMFSSEEALAVSLGLLAAQGLGIADTTPALETAQTKLERVMPARLKEQAHALSESARLELPPPQAPCDERLLILFATATQARQRARLAYRDDRAQHSDRVLNPYGLVYREGRWYVSGWCHLRRDLRSFRLDRITEATLLEASFERPTDFDPAEHLTQSIASLPRATAVSVRLYSDLASAIAELGSSIGVFTPEGNGVMLHARTDCLTWFARQLAHQPFDFEIIDPPGLRAALSEQAARLQRLAAEK
ncbi:helix-turn-helix transcriptional regulator [Halomonas sp. hl-4]|uniref:helix-turn-helix transcriptional regulator n=1 Tax=Halomonas sp. hl-4 TaxID=1761789 RepID=UPI0006D9B00B|nr:YafY family protein [Halomonas sp. hl-4]KPQ19942.1 MAG: putative transcriptional regulator [Halomonas sp. HL-93]SBR52639.1 transcriptional regulator [Halomonas sp. HL-93]SNY97897.1 transcriptional regulator [Halomonas sp. hl-4]